MRSPLWSVMLPVYEPNSYIKEAIRSVLDQDPGNDHMQIAMLLMMRLQAAGLRIWCGPSPATGLVTSDNRVIWD